MALQLIDECINFINKFKQSPSQQQNDINSLECFLNPQISAYFQKSLKLDEMIYTAQKIACRGKGILAADASPGTIGKRLMSINIKNTFKNRERYRELFITTPNISKYISGIILHEETLYQKTSSNVLFTEILNKSDVILGIKVDKRTRSLPYYPNETYTQGLNDLDIRCEQYYNAGARFVKWRSSLIIQNGYISSTAIRETAYTLARYASISQNCGLVPIVEPEILMDGNHSLSVNQYWTEKVISECYSALIDNNVILEATLLKPNMCLAGKQNKSNYNYSQNAHATIMALKRTVPPAVPGIMFLSGGQSEEDATMNLNEMNKLYTNLPWSVSFSFGRSLQQSAMIEWNGNNQNILSAQNEFIKRAKANSEAQLGQYKGDIGGINSNSDLFVDDTIRH